MNKYQKYKEKKKGLGICTNCGKNKIDFSRSKSKCSLCLDKRNKAFSDRVADKGFCKRCLKNRINYLRSKSYCSKCLDYNLSYVKSYKAKNIERIRETERYSSKKYSSKRRARIAGGGGNFTRKEWQSLLDKFGRKCLWCGNSRVTADHVVPIFLGGSSNIQNIQPLCKSCNSKKKTKILDFRPFGTAILDWT